ncbi:thermonuclease family protein [Falsigemmobacter faecalis]|uniref:TNase-like domain-containing protein n=1 Tax=Falsigemmobacter faecalis TaxID=2488730 RepID=A0A3P3DJE3_9RHOB|nr:thermonuclease family protein [Falsigemmobacter faecalis]RRH73826.1 hypothetical protein EG244_12210 [Falsigemmobacter faecalis]
METFGGIVLSLAALGAIWFVLSLLTRENRNESPPEQPASWSQPKPAPRPAPRPAAPAPARVTQTSDFPPEILCGRAWVVDGDTLKIRNRPLRLFGVDAPEMDHPYGISAQRALKKLCSGHEVRAAIVGCDDYGREVAKCSLPDGRDLSAEMVKLGLAIDWPKFSGGLYTHLEVEGLRKKLWLADARQKGRMHVWEKYAADQARKAAAKARG